MTIGTSRVIVGSVQDPHVAAILAKVPSTGTVVIDASTAATIVRRLTTSETVLRDVEGADVVLSTSGRCFGWIRRLAPAGWDLGVALGSEEAATLRSQVALLSAVVRDPAVQWLTPIDRLTAAENKIIQYRVAEAMGIRVPRTLLALDPLDLRETLGEPFVLKPLGPGNYVDEDGNQHVIYVRPASAADIGGADPRRAPFIGQELIRAQKHLRVLTLNRAAWCTEIEASKSPVDWREDWCAHGAFKTARNSFVEGQAVSMASVMGVGFSSQDWVISDGKPHFLDLNPGGQWLFLPEDATTWLSEALAEWMTGSTL